MLHKQLSPNRQVAFAAACVVSAALTCLVIIKCHKHDCNFLAASSSIRVSRKRSHVDDGFYEHSQWNSTSVDHSYLYAKLDEQFLMENFNQLKKVVKPLSRKYKDRVDELMKHRLPVIDTSGWRLHRPSGEPMTVPEAQQMIRDPSYRVPNAAHYILPFADPELQFHHLVCILSGFWVMRADHVFLWYSEQPRGPNWDLLRLNLTLSGVWESRVVMVNRSVPQLVYRQPVLLREHQSDVMRMEALLVFGGVYFDLDVIALKSMAPLRNRSFTIGRELPANLCNGVILAEPNSSLLALWHVAYQTFDDSGWGEHSLMLPNRLCGAHSQHCHVEEESLDRPNFMSKEIVLIYGPKRGWDWRTKNYAMHLWYRSHKKQYTMDTIRRVDSMLGDMFRFVLYGNSSVQQLPADGKPAARKPLGGAF